MTLYAAWEDCSSLVLVLSCSLLIHNLPIHKLSSIGTAYMLYLQSVNRKKASIALDQLMLAPTYRAALTPAGLYHHLYFSLLTSELSTSTKKKLTVKILKL